MTYVIQKGDSPWVVSKRFYGTPLKFRVIQEDNNLIENSKFHPGRTLKIRIE
jgi:nucleoid-associated protein YgaU